MITNALTCKYLRLHIIILYYSDILCSSNKKVSMRRLYVILLDLPRETRWSRTADAPGSLSICMMLPLHPNMSLGLVCAKVCWNVTVLIYCWSCLCHGISLGIRASWPDTRPWNIISDIQHKAQGYTIQRGIVCAPTKWYCSALTGWSVGNLHLS